MENGEKKSESREIQKRLADSSGLAVVLVDENSSEISAANNNSMCAALRNSAEFAPRCAEFCGKAYKIAAEADKIVHVKCHADLSFLAVPLQTDEKKFAAIVGRIFLTLEDYRKAANRASAGDFSRFPADRFFRNVLLSGASEDLEKTAKKVSENKDLLAVQIEKKTAETPVFKVEKNDLGKEIPKPDTKLFEQEKQSPIAEDNTQTIEKTKVKIDADVWRATFGNLLGSDYKNACRLILDFVGERFGFADSVWLEICDESLETVAAVGRFKDENIQINLSADDARLIEVLQNEDALELRERRGEDLDETQSIWLFPFAVGGKIRGALLLVNGKTDTENKKKISRFANKIAPQTEILRLRQELERQTVLSQTLKRFNESLSRIDPEDFWEYLSNFCVEMMQSERSSLLFYDETARKFTVKNATGKRAEIIRQEAETLGKKIAEGVYESGEPLVVSDISETEIPSAPSDWKYKTNSFISYPITLGERKIGVLNVADRTTGKTYGNFDLELLDSITPQISLAFDRLALKRKASEFEQLSVTDSLTGLSNRRYLEARLNEEIKRSQRNGSPMSFMMIDVDEFKTYNDAFGHPEGDKALQIVARCLRETLRGADVAARFGGEEFSILLPQTTLPEAFLTAERVRQKVEQTIFPNRAVTVSIGVAACPPNCNSDDLISAADHALYEAKKAGRNAVRVFE